MANVLVSNRHEFIKNNAGIHHFQSISTVQQLFGQKDKKNDCQKIVLKYVLKSTIFTDIFRNL